MKIASLFLIIIVCCCYCATTTKSTQEDTVKLKLFAHPKQGFKPLTVVFEAEIINYEGKEDKYSCLTEKWDFGDGSKSSHQANCKEKLEFKNKFIISHTYYSSGKYRAQFVLGDNKLRSDIAWINVLIAGI